jgi:preprotein translocase subunit YajC
MGVCGVREEKVSVMANPCGETWSNAIPPVLLIVSVQMYRMTVQGKRQKQHTSPFGTLADGCEVNLFIPI